MAQPDVKAVVSDPSAEATAPPVVAPFTEGRTRAPLVPQTAGGGCSCGATGMATGPASFVYAIGQIEWRYPNLSVEKEFAQATGRSDTNGLSDRQALHAVVTKKDNRYLARQLCYVLTIGGLETYLLRPRDPADLSMLIEGVRSNPKATDLDVVIGVRGPLAPPELCNGLVVPIVGFDQIYSFDTAALIQTVPRPDKIAAEKFGPIAEELFGRILQMADNAGATDEHRALNYLAVRYDAIYARAAEMFERDHALTAVDARPSPLSGTRKIVDVIFTYTHRPSDFAEKFFVRVDVTEMFPFLVTKLSPYFDR